ncbi:hypothetical protein BO70DRAFT_13203 [Aspergillus heteromorphus CBS 117.55]|uniref:Ribonuclease H2 subunit B n=1 Tax=Aspergillus heteromorphus CBS 117.55 TaxID=1448321 RepID=A0A317X4T3_9EURO|nr:uncharacterized protein BO70DRAFT_13203 [Aspergillus heteromorphus CBS 117.55]PWY92527.1 hypothetical protein BO70DRAFT_13203 [Aspergillus heteromorphus CBS 117.55]
MRTRSKAPPTKSQSQATSDSKQKTSQSASAPLPPPTKPNKTFILPSSASASSRILTLPNPQTNTPTQYFFCPNLGVHEFTVIASPATAPRSILSARKPTDDETSARATKPQGHITQNAELLVATPIDFLFFLVPLLSASTAIQGGGGGGGGKGLFQPLDDIIDSQDELPKHFRHVLYDDTFRAALHDRAAAICDSVEAGDETMYRFSETKLLLELVAKADRMVAMGLPPSLEEQFVRQALATPLMAVKREDVGVAPPPPSASDDKENKGDGEDEEEKKTPSEEISATTTATATATETETETGKSTPATEQIPEGPSIPDGVADLLRVSTALTFMKECYLSKAMSARIDELLAAPESPKDFKPMQEHLKLVASLRAQALASRSLGDFSRKRSAEDQEAAELRAEKKRKKEEEEKKKKASESRGVRDLKKVNTVGMKKMSDFFGKAAPKKKA